MYNYNGAKGTSKTGYNGKLVTCMCGMCRERSTVKTWEADGWASAPVRARGGNNGYLCADHAEHLEQYSKENRITIGLPKASGITFSIELETAQSNIVGRMELCGLGYLPTSDCTVDVEYKSPIYNGECSLQKTLKSIETMISNGEIEIDDRCGTHLHVGHVDFTNDARKRVAARYEHLFSEFESILSERSDNGAVLFGRKFSMDWAFPCCEEYASVNDLSADNGLRFTFARGVQRRVNLADSLHGVCINLQHTEQDTNDYNGNPLHLSATLEFRQCRFRNSAQYALCVKMAREVMAAVVDWTQNGNCDAASADKAGRKIGRILSKYLSKAEDVFTAQPFTF